MTASDFQTSRIDAWNRARGARMVPVRRMRCRSSTRVIAEHLWTDKAGLFDSPHGQLTFHGPNVYAALEPLLPRRSAILKDGRLFIRCCWTTCCHSTPDGDAPRRAFLVVVNGSTKDGYIETSSEPAALGPCSII